MAKKKAKQGAEKQITISDDKEVVNRRLVGEVESLKQSKESLETELTRSNKENEALKTELDWMDEMSVQSEVERDVVGVYVRLQTAQEAELVDGERSELKKEKELYEKRLRGLEEEMKEVLRAKSEVEKVKGEMEAEIKLLNGKLDELEVEISMEKKFSDEACRGRDEMKAELDIKISEAGRLKWVLGVSEKKAKLIQDEVEKLRDEYKVVMEMKKEGEREIESITKDKNRMEKRLSVSESVIELMKNDIKKADLEKGMINDEKNLEVMKRSDLENRVSELDNLVAACKNEEGRLRSHVAELEKRVLEGTEKEMEMNRRIDESVELEKQVSELKDAITRIVESSDAQMKQSKHMESVVNRYRDDLKRVTSERNAARKELEEEKLNCVSLERKSSELEKNIEDTLKLVEKMKAENKSMSSEKGELESYCNTLKNEIASLQNDLSKAKKVLDVLQDKEAARESESERLLEALNATAEFVHSNLEKVATLESNLVDKDRNREMEPCVVADKLEEIKNAFKIKENTVEEMKLQVEVLQRSVVVAQKKKSFWALFSYATTFLAAFSVAYFTHGHRVNLFS